jgi:thiol-disulfide isomerase/thioredoxin
MKHVYLFLLFFPCAGCSGQQNNGAKTEQAEDPRTFRMISIPGILTEPTERANYLAKHYWDLFDFSDTAYIHLPAVTETALADFIDIMPHVSPEVAPASIKEMLEKTKVEARMFAHFAALYEKYLYDPNSPMRNDELYIPVLQTLLASETISEADNIRLAHQLEIALRNRVGERATDFAYTLPNGQTSTLHRMASDYTLLFFYNPDCHNCKEVAALLQASPVIARLMEEKRLKILAVYPDEDLRAWRTHLPDIPQEWINAYDDGARLKEDEAYDLKAIPTLYLLDKEKRVLLKDTTCDLLEQFLQTQ